MVWILLQKPDDWDLNGLLFFAWNVADFARMKKNKNFVTLKRHFDKRDQSFLVTTFWKFWTMKILMVDMKTNINCF